MNMRVHAAERVGPVNLGAGLQDYICKLFGTFEGGQATVEVNRTEYESAVRALADGKFPTTEVYAKSTLAIQIRQEDKAVIDQARERMAQRQ